MTEFKTIHPDITMPGQMVIDFEQAINSKDFLPILKVHGLDNVKADEWIPAQKWIDVLNDIVSSDNNFLSLVSIGMKQIDNVDWPPEFQDMGVEEVLRSLHSIYLAHCRGTDVGGIEFEKMNDDHYKLTLRVFEPDDIWYGNIYQIVKKFNKAKREFIVIYDDEKRRDHGSYNTVIHIKFRD